MITPPCAGRHFRAQSKSIMIPDSSRAPPSLNDRTKHGEASALRSQAVAKGLMVLPWQLLRAYCYTPLVDPYPLPSYPLRAPRMAYLFACSIGTRTHATHLRMHACMRYPRACVSCIYASMPVVPNPLTYSGQCPEFKDEGSRASLNPGRRI